MKHFAFRYESSVVLNAPVTAHSFLLRALPRTEQFQRVEWDSLRVAATLPNGRTIEVPVHSRKDAFGNGTQAGCMLPPHVGLSMEAVGRVSQSPYRICGTALFASKRIASSPLLRSNLSKTDEICEPKNAEIIAGGASLAPKR